MIQMQNILMYVFICVCLRTVDFKNCEYDPICIILFTLTKSIIYLRTKYTRANVSVNCVYFPILIYKGKIGQKLFLF